MIRRIGLLGPIALILTALIIPVFPSSQAAFDLVILNGRVIDPESRADAIRNLGISNGTIKAVTTRNLSGRAVIDARGLVVAPGFIDLHQHGQDDENYRFKAMDGVTTALELEVGTGDIDAWYAKLDRRWQAPDRLTALIVAVKPVNPPKADSDPARFVRDLVLDPTFQLK